MIRLGVDHSGVKSGLNAARTQMAGFQAGVMADTASATAGQASMLQKGISKSLGTLKNLFRINLYAMIAQGAEWWISEGRHMLAAKMTGLDKLEGEEGRDQDAFMEALRKRMLLEAAQRKSLAAQTLKTITENAEKIRNVSIEAWKAAAGEHSEKVLKFELKVAHRESILAFGDLRNARSRKTALEISNAELQFEKAKLALIRAQVALRDFEADKRAKQIEKENAVNMDRRRKIAELLGSGAFAGELDQIKRLEEDAQLADRFGNRGRATVDRVLIGGLMRDVRQRIDAQLTPAQTQQDMLIGKILDAFAPIRDERGMPVRVVNTD